MTILRAALPVFKFLVMLILFALLSTALAVVLAIFMASIMSSRLEETFRVAHALAATILFGLILPRVGYRLRDLLLLLIPFVNVYFAAKWLWRYAALPGRHWSKEPSIA